jgi:hypothetical protein
MHKGEHGCDLYTSIVIHFVGCYFPYAFTQPNILNKEQYLADGNVLKVTWFQKMLTQMLNPYHANVENKVS